MTQHELEHENRVLRSMLAHRVAGAGLYRDDGELQDNTALPCIDFLRDTPQEIQAKLIKRNFPGWPWPVMEMKA